MTVDEAVEVLNKRKHRDIRGWYCYQVNNSPDSLTVVGPNRHDDWFEPFEAIAIAEKYIRESP